MSALIDPTTTPAWAKLTDLAAALEPDLRGWFADDPGRAERFTFTAADLHVDLSKNLLDDAILAALDEDNLAVVKLPQPEPSPDGDGVMFHGRDSAMVIFVDDDGRIWDSDGEWTRGQSRANAAAFLAAARHAGAGERGE